MLSMTIHRAFGIDILLFLLLMNSWPLSAQPQISDTIIGPTTKSPKPPDSIVNKQTIHTSESDTKESWREFTNYFRLDFFTSMNASHYINPRGQATDKNNYYLYYNLNINNQFHTKYLSINAYLFNELGFRHYIDSISIKNEDSYSYKIDINSPLRQQLNFNLSYLVKSQLWNSWEYRIDSTNQAKAILLSSYFSPGYIIYTGGFSYNFWETAKVELGLVGGEITKIKNNTLYDTRKENVLYGIEKGKRKQINFGLSAQLQIPIHKIGKFFYWENNSQLFVKGKDIQQFKQYQLDMTNGIHFLFLKYMRIGLRTKLNYDINVSEKVSINTMLLFGFYLSNKL